MKILIGVLVLFLATGYYFFKDDHADSTAEVDLDVYEDAPKVKKISRSKFQSNNLSDPYLNSTNVSQDTDTIIRENNELQSGDNNYDPTYAADEDELNQNLQASESNFVDLASVGELNYSYVSEKSPVVFLEEGSDPSKEEIAEPSRDVASETPTESETE